MTGTPTQPDARPMPRTRAEVDVFDYADYRAYLADVLAWKRATVRGFSVRQFSLKAGLSTENYLLRVLRKKRNLGPKVTERFAAALALDGPSARYFAALTRVEGSKTTSERATALGELERARRRRRRFAPITDNAILRHWHTAAILELGSCREFQLAPRSAARALRHKISVQQAKEAIAFLLERGYLREKDGRLAATDEPIVSTNGVADPLVRLNHRETIGAALEAIDQPLADRGFFGLTIACSRARLPEIKARLKTFVDGLHAELALDPGSDTVYRINAHCFPLARTQPGPLAPPVS